MPLAAHAGIAASAGTSRVGERHEAAQRRRETVGTAHYDKSPKKGSAHVAALAAAQKAAEKEAEWRAGAAKRAEENKQMRMAQLAEVEAEDALRREQEAAMRREQEARAAKERAAAAQAQAEREAQAAAEAHRRAEEETRDRFVWGSDAPAAGGGTIRSARCAAAGGMAAGGGASSQPRLTSASHTLGASIENGNRLGQRPVVRQSRTYRQNESGNAMKAALGHDELAWETDALQGVFAGQGVYDAYADRVIGFSGAPPTASARGESSKCAAQRRPASARSAAKRAPRGGSRERRPASVERARAAAPSASLHANGGGTANGGFWVGGDEADAPSQAVDERAAFGTTFYGAAAIGLAAAAPRLDSPAARRAAAAAAPTAVPAAAPRLDSPAARRAVAPAGVTPAAAPPVRSAVMRMKELKGLLDEGFIEQHEYEVVRRGILEEL